MKYSSGSTLILLSLRETQAVQDGCRAFISISFFLFLLICFVLFESALEVLVLLALFNGVCGISRRSHPQHTQSRFFAYNKSHWL